MVGWHEVVIAGSVLQNYLRSASGLKNLGAKPSTTSSIAPYRGDAFFMSLIPKMNVVTHINLIWRKCRSFQRAIMLAML
jgi:hypothetical protein